MMANWEKLNSEFDKLINSLSDSDWENWASNRVQRKTMRRQEMLLKSKIQEEKIFFDSLNGANIIFKGQTCSPLAHLDISTISSNSISLAKAGENNYALAA